MTSHFPFVEHEKRAMYAIFTLVTLKMVILHCFSSLPFHSSYWPGPGSIHLKHNLSLITCNLKFSGLLSKVTKARYEDMIAIFHTNDRKLLIIKRILGKMISVY